ncbi:hypothetical protein BELL_0191g00110 [Botrytis elliptica]|uniref:Uncharacterized protein n=1 Tax=Botrytis elliptica TaxID=278938 RepID=A0A4Z1JQE4_9HELO|nr:hypothetical protein EAE99_002031 [Botrytis elliptica]TGO75808.1 hypothetical protein BELL_0191g00110 [Botrytis elliptica]
MANPMKTYEEKKKQLGLVHKAIWGPQWDRRANTNPQWRWMSKQWQRQGREPRTEVGHFDFYPYPQKWQDYVDAVKQKPNILPSFQEDNNSTVYSDVIDWGFRKQVRQTNGPFPVFNIGINPQHQGWFIPTHRSLDAKYRFPGTRNVAGPHQNEESTGVLLGVFVGFRRVRRDKWNPWWWEVVYARLDKRDRALLHAYNYNYLGMPLSAVKKGKGTSWKCRTNDIIWVEALEHMTMEERTEWIGDQVRRPAASYHNHCADFNELRCAFNLPPFYF